MATKKHDVIGIGSAIVDIIGRCDDAFLVKHGAPKGNMRLVSAAEIDQLYNAMGPAIEVSGGSVANTVAGIASFGGKAAFVGRYADDQFGKIFAHDIRAIGVAFSSKPSPGGKPTSRSLILVTPDGERTMNTFLGISTDLAVADIDAEGIKASKIVYLEGYLFDQPAGMAAFREAAKIAKAAGTEVALSLSDAFCVDRHRAEFLKFVREDVDILFANEGEVMSLYEAKDFDTAAAKVRKDVKLAALTRSGKGSVLLLDGEPATNVAAVPGVKVVDTTGAGDLYAAGVLFGLTQGKDLAACGMLGSLAAGEVISHLGARPEKNLRALAKAQGLV
jgi:sugar/nucleoside kinase (ribokinase family)